MCWACLFPLISISFGHRFQGAMKHMRYVLLFLIFLLPPSLFSQAIQQGDFAADLNSEGWTLDRGVGVRAHILFVKFDNTFQATPAVLVSLTGYEAFADTTGSIRISSRAENITSSGFVIKVWTWGSSRINSVNGSWLAIGK